ncbi:MAG: DUF4436 domain-containing protein [Methanothrix sp.]|nr:MAG: DUF4436 domain-containing protein [Methanothrix sp.]
MPNTKAAAIGGLIAVIIFALSYYLALNAYQNESEDQVTLFVTGDTNKSDSVDIVANIISLDPQREEAKIRLSFYPKGKLSYDGLSCIYDLKLIAPEAGRSDSTKIFPRGVPLSSVELSYVMVGQVNDYPFDEHTIQLIFALNRTDPDLIVPSAVLIRGNVPGFKISLEPLSELLPEGVNAMKMTVTRSWTVRGAAMAGIVVMWAIGIGVFALIVLMFSGWYNVRMPALFAALLFGLFSLRNSLPGTPPIGTYSDFIAFLWVQGIVALALLVAIIATLKNRPT